MKINKCKWFGHKWIPVFRKKLTYKERIDWFVVNFYETGMEYEIIYDSFKNEDLDRIKWYNDFIKIPKYKDEL